MPTYIDHEQALEVLAAMGVDLSLRQIKRASEPDAHGQRRLPFFLDPIDGKLKIERETLRRIYIQRQVAAENNCAAFDDFSL